MKWDKGFYIGSPLLNQPKPRHLIIIKQTRIFAENRVRSTCQKFDEISFAMQYTYYIPKQYYDIIRLQCNYVGLRLVEFETFQKRSKVKAVLQL